MGIFERGSHLDAKAPEICPSIHRPPGMGERRFTVVRVAAILGLTTTTRAAPPHLYSLQTFTEISYFRIALR